MKCPLTYKQIQEYVKQHYGYAVQTCVIASILKDLGYEVGVAWNSGTAKKAKSPVERDRIAIRSAIYELVH